MHLFFKKNKIKLDKKRNYKIFNFSKGFTLLEIIITMSILVVMSLVSVGSYLNYGKTIEINSFAQTLIFDLKQTQSKAMIGQGGFKWGVHFVNGTKDYYEIFSTPTLYGDAGKVVTATNYLPSSITFSDPTDGSTKDIIFNNISGSTTTTSVVLRSQNVSKTISVSSVGSISVQ